MEGLSQVEDRTSRFSQFQRSRFEKFVNNNVTRLGLEFYGLFAIEELLARTNSDDGMDRLGAAESFRRIIFPGGSFGRRQELIGADGNRCEKQSGCKK